MEMRNIVFVCNLVLRLCTNQIGLEENCWVENRPTVMRLSGKVDNHIGLELIHQPIDKIGVYNTPEGKIVAAPIFFSYVLQVFQTAGLGQ